MVAITYKSQKNIYGPRTLGTSEKYGVVTKFSTI